MKRNSLRKVSLFLSLALIFMVAADAQAKHRRSRSARAKTITASGCVSAGVEAACLILTDSKTSAVYTLLFSRTTKPAVGDAIRMTGTVHSGPTICMQGTAVNVRKWTRVKMKCPAPAQ